MGVARPDGPALSLGVILLGVPVPSPTGLRLVTSTTGGDRAREGTLWVTGLTRAVVVAGTYMGKEEMGLPMEGGGETSGGGETGGVWATVETTFTGLCGFGRMTGGESLVGTGCTGVAAGAGVGLATVILRVVLALAGVKILEGDSETSRWVGDEYEGVVAGVGTAVDTGACAGWAGGAGLAGGAAAGWAGAAGEEGVGLLPAGFIGGTVIVEVTREGPDTDGTVLTTTAPAAF